MSMSTAALYARLEAARDACRSADPYAATLMALHLRLDRAKMLARGTAEGIERFAPITPPPPAMVCAYCDTPRSSQFIRCESCGARKTK